MQAPDINLTQDSPNATPKGTRRPHLEVRGFTERGAIAESPSLLAADQSDPVDRVSNLSELEFFFFLYADTARSFSFDPTVIE
jgi:hypothetical protein